MSIPIARPEHTLRQAFEELDRAAQEAADQSHAVTVAQGRVDAAQALQAAAQVQLKNAEARHSVLAKSLELAAPDLEALQARYAERESELTLVREQLLIVGAQEETVAQAQAALRDLFESLRGIRADAVLALEAMRGSVEEIRQLPRLQGAVRTMCESLERTYNDLRERQAGYEVALTELDAAIGALRVEIPAAGYQRALEAAQERLELDLLETGRELEAKRPGIDLDELRRAKDDLDAARFAVDEAPKAVQRANRELQAASDALADARQGQQAAQDRLDGIEAEFVAGIEVSAPNAAGLVTARAQLSQDIPAGYTLRWQAGPASVMPETGDAVSIDTSQLPIGDTLIEARLVRLPALA